jgi:hypothetical protein
MFRQPLALNYGESSDSQKTSIRIKRGIPLRGTLRECGNSGTGSPKRSGADAPGNLQWQTIREAKTKVRIE